MLDMPIPVMYLTGCKFMDNFELIKIILLPQTKEQLITNIHLTHWGLKKMAAILQMTFSNSIFLWKFLNFKIQISLQYIHRVLINNTPVLVEIMAWHQKDDKPLSQSMMV